MSACSDLASDSCDASDPRDASASVKEIEHGDSEPEMIARCCKHLTDCAFKHVASVPLCHSISRFGLQIIHDNSKQKQQKAGD